MIDFISNIPLFESLTLNEIETVSRYVQRQELKSGEILLTLGAGDVYKIGDELIQEL